MLYCSELLCLGSVYRAGVLAGTAVDALIGIDYINVAGRNSLYGALTNAGTASNASVSNSVSHSLVVLS